MWVVESTRYRSLTLHTAAALGGLRDEYLAGYFCDAIPPQFRGIRGIELPGSVA